MDKKIDLQLFGAGDVVHTTEAYINTNDRADIEKYGENGLSAEMKTFYDKTLIELAKPTLVFDQFGQKRSIPANGGPTIEFRRFNSLPKATNPIVEGITPSGSKLSVTPVTATVEQYGDYVELTDMLELTSVDPVVVEATRQLADQAARTIDTVVRNEILGGTNVMYCPNIDEEGNIWEIGERNQVTYDSKLRVEDVFKAAAQLKAMNAPTFNGSYVAVIHPYVAYDLMQDAKGQWIDIQKYASPENILSGEIGTLAGVRFVQSTEAKVYAGFDLTSETRELAVLGYVDDAEDVYATVGEATPYRVTVGKADKSLVGREIIYRIANGMILGYADIVGVNTENGYVYLDNGDGITFTEGDKMTPGEGGADGIPVFVTMFIGANAYGTTDIAGGGIEHIIKQKGYGNDPLNQRSSVGWKATKAAARLVEEYMLRVESSSSLGYGVRSAN